MASRAIVREKHRPVLMHGALKRLLNSSYGPAKHRPKKRKAKPN